VVQEGIRVAEMTRRSGVMTIPDRVAFSNARNFFLNLIINKISSEGDKK
jgi:hypothetical protein